MQKRTRKHVKNLDRGCGGTKMKLLRYSFFNLLGLGLPLLVAAFTIPKLIAGLGEARFGVLTIIWALVSYFGLFDLGLGRALTLQLVQLHSSKDGDKMGALVTTTLVFMGGLGLVAAVAFGIFAPLGLKTLNANLSETETFWAGLAMAAALPFIIVTSGLRGILEARNAFGFINLIRLPMGIYTFLGPYLSVIFGHSELNTIAFILAGGRMVATAVHGWMAWHVLKPENPVFSYEAKLLTPLCISGGWMTVSNIVSPFMGYIDRILIGFLLSAPAVTYYATPNEIVTKLWIIPGAMTSVLFPAFASPSSHIEGTILQDFLKAIFWLYMILLPTTFFLAVLAKPILSFWISPAFAYHSYPVMQVFCLGILINSMAHVPFSLLQAIGASKTTAKVHMFELPLFLVLLWILTTNFGILGASFAWLGRMLFDTIAMFAACKKAMGWKMSALISFKGIACMLGGAACFAIAALKSA